MIKKFSRLEALEDIKEVLENGYNGYSSDLHHEVFNTGYYVIGTNRAEKYLTRVGIFDAFEKIKEYEQDNFGEVTTDFSSAESVANMLYYIIGEEALNDVTEKFNDILYENETLDDEEVRMALIQELEIAIKAEKQ